MSRSSLYQRQVEMFPAMRNLTSISTFSKTEITNRMFKKTDRKKLYAFVFFFLGKCFLVYNPNLTSESISGTSISGPMTVANAAPEPIP